MKKILFISRKAERCGVADYGKRVNNILQTSNLFQTIWAEIETAEDYIKVFTEHHPDIVLYNYYCTYVLLFVFYTVYPFCTYIFHIFLLHLYFHLPKIDEL